MNITFPHSKLLEQLNCCEKDRVELLVLIVRFFTKLDERLSLVKPKISIEPKLVDGDIDGLHFQVDAIFNEPTGKSIRVSSPLPLVTFSHELKNALKFNDGTANFDSALHSFYCALSDFSRNLSRRLPSAG